MNLNISLLLLRYPDRSWLWGIISSRKDISLDVIEKCIDQDWSFLTISHREDLTSEFIVKHRDKAWNIISLMRNNSIRKNDAAIIIQRTYRKYGDLPRWRKWLKENIMAIKYSPIAKGSKFKKNTKRLE